jgi:hypothetical protein
MNLIGRANALPFLLKETYLLELEKDAFDFQVLNLTHAFYNDYPDPPYKEIVRKDNRPYNCLLIQSHYDYFICVPYRSHINHKFAYKFKNSARSKRTNSGLDYSKIVIIKELKYLEDNGAIVDKDEYNETRDNIEYIKNDAMKYVDNYVAYFKGDSSKYNEQQFKRTYGYSTLPYFHKELGINLT